MSMLTEKTLDVNFKYSVASNSGRSLSDADRKTTKNNPNTKRSIYARGSGEYKHFDF